jgi:hypothetical protein
MTSSWTDLLTTPTLQAVAGMLILCVLIAVAFNLVSRFRDYAVEDRYNADSVMANFQEMLRRGEITAAEYRNIQARSVGVSTTQQPRQSASTAETRDAGGGCESA